MAKRKHTSQRSRINEGAERPGFTRRSNVPPPSSRGSSTMTWLILGGIGVLAVVVVAAYAAGWVGKPGATPTPVAVVDCPTPDAARPSGAPTATPLSNPPAQPIGDGTTATITTDKGNITFELFCGSAPVASENFINLATAGYYNGVVFHRLVPDFMIQGGDPDGTGRGGPGYTIQDEPTVGEYNRGMVAMARTSAPDSQGSQFFIIVKDSPFLDGGDYTIFGEVTQGMDVVDQISLMPTANDDPGGRGGTALDPVIMRSVTIQHP
jgi:peptidyl-prolyl cis-trans isomerase B (cyclophilin B)